MTKLAETIQGNLETHIFKCYCGEDSYLEVMQDSEDKEFYISITMHPTSISERIKAAWKALRGLEFSASNTVIILEEDADKLAAALTKRGNET